MPKALLQPQLVRNSSVATENMTEASSEASKVPAPTETCCHEPAQARRPGGAFSTRNAEEVPNSPPAEKPCTQRARVSSRGAATPIWA